MIAYLGLGSNMGEARAFVEEGVRRIGLAWPGAKIARSEAVVSEPWGYDSPNAYVNLVVRIETPVPASEAGALAMLDALQAIEREVSAVPHRNADGSYRDRELDIDIIAVEGLTMDHPRLTLPHPRAAQREFVTGPMRELGAGHLLG